jgi:hypothetical protein
VKPILQSLKKYSYLAYGAPLLVLLLPFVGQGWHLDVWRWGHKFAFMPVYILLLIRLNINSNEKVGFSWIGALFGSFFVSGMTGRFAYSNRNQPPIACLDSLTLILLYAVLIWFAPRLRKSYDKYKGPETEKVTFDLTAETFRLPPQSNDPANYPRI